MAKIRFWFSVGYKLVAGIISGVALWAQFNNLGLNAWRLLETWLLIVATGYFLAATVVEWFHRKAPMPHRSFCPLLQGTIIVVGISLGCLRIAYAANSLEWLGARDPLGYVQLLAVPLLALGDWLFFTKKGDWGLSYPWYWLGIIISYCCIILLTAEFLPSQNSWDYPYIFLNYSTIGIDNLLCWLLLIIVIALTIGYVLMFGDFTLSGNLGRHVVMPRIKTIIIEEPAVVEPEAVTSAEVQRMQTNVKQEADTKVATKPSTSTSTKPKVTPKAKQQPSMDIIKPVEGLKDRKSAQKIHRTNKSKSEIIADMRLQVSGNKNPKSRPRTNTTKSTKKS